MVIDEAVETYCYHSSIIMLFTYASSVTLVMLLHQPISYEVLEK